MSGSLYLYRLADMDYVILESQLDGTTTPYFIGCHIGRFVSMMIIIGTICIAHFECAIISAVIVV